MPTTWTVKIPGSSVTLAGAAPPSQPDDLQLVVAHVIRIATDRLVEADLALREWLTLYGSLRDLDEDGRRLLHLYARAHLLALDQIREFLLTLEKLLLIEPQLSAVTTLSDVYDQAFGPLSEIRNSVMHLGDRFRLVRQGEKPIAVPQGDASVGHMITGDGSYIAGRRIGARFISDVTVVAGKAVSWGGFFDDRYHVLTKDGSIAEFPLRPSNLPIAAGVVQQVVDAFAKAPFAWAGGERIVSRTFA